MFFYQGVFGEVQDQSKAVEDNDGEEDDGDGFSRDVLDKLGEPYISKNKKGMGLGIFIAKNLIENMKGNIVFYNSINNGAVVEIKFDKTILI